MNGKHHSQICDRISDENLDACLTPIPEYKSAYETCSETGMVTITGEFIVMRWTYTDKYDGVYKRLNGATETSEEEDLTNIDVTVHKNLTENTITDASHKREHDTEKFIRHKIVRISQEDVAPVTTPIDGNFTIGQDFAAADSCDPPSGVPKTEHLSIANCEHVDSTTTMPCEDKVMTTEEITVVGIIDCWISADETAGKRLLTKFDGDKPKTSVRHLFF